MSAAISTLTDATFDEEIGAAEAPVLVDFWAEWCGPCKMIAPILDQIGEEQAGKLKIAKLNVDDNPEVARRFEVMSIPTLILFKDGDPAARIIGAKGKSQLLADITPPVALAAYASHAADPAVRGNLQTAAMFAFGHGIALAALARGVQSRLALAGLAMLLTGTLLFSGALAAKALLGLSSAPAPFGGSLMILAWLLLAAAALRD